MLAARNSEESVLSSAASYHSGITLSPWLRKLGYIGVCLNPLHWCYIPLTSVRLLPCLLLTVKKIAMELELNWARAQVWLWAAWSCGWRPCMWQGGLKLDNGPFQPRPFYDDSMMWWFYDLFNRCFTFLNKSVFCFILCYRIYRNVG